MSLRELLDNGAFFDGDKTCTYTQTEKYLLVLNLARCFFYLYDGPWGPCDWTADRIFFLHKPGADEIDGRLTPYVCCHLPNGVRNGALEVARDEVCPPVLLSFARLLLEIERGEVLPTTSANSPKNKDLHKQLSHMVEHELEYKLAGPYQKAIEGCLYFDADLMTARGATKDIQARHVILHNIVENLRQQYYFYLWEAPPPENTALRLASVTLETERQTWKPSTLSGSGLTDKVPSLHQNPRAPSETFMQDINNRSSLRSTTYASAFILFDDMYESSENDSLVFPFTLPLSHTTCNH